MASLAWPVLRGSVDRTFVKYNKSENFASEPNTSGSKLNCTCLRSAKIVCGLFEVVDVSSKNEWHVYLVTILAFKFILMSDSVS